MKKNLVFYYIFAIGFLGSLVNTDTAKADLIPGFDKKVPLPKYFTTGGGSTFNSVLNHYFNSILTIVLAVISAIAVLLLIRAGLDYITSNGNAEQAKKAQQTILSVIFGIIILSSAYAILGLIIGLLNSAAGSVN